MVDSAHFRWLLRRRGRTARRGRRGARRRLGRRREHTHTLGILWHLWAQAGPGPRGVRRLRRYVCDEPPGSCLSHARVLIIARGAGPNPGFEAVRPVAGPMGRSVADLERMARILFGEREGAQEHSFPAPVPYRDVTLPGKLRFGYYLNGVSGLSHRTVLATLRLILLNVRHKIKRWSG